MKRLARTFLFLAACAFAGPAAAQACKAPADSGYQGIRFFLGIEPSDGILDVWCRIQSLKGKTRVRIEFPAVGAGRTTEFEFTGSPTLPREALASYIQSLLPARADAPARDPIDGMPFAAALDGIVQAAATRTPDGQMLGLPTAWPSSKALALWQPVILRARPLYIGGKEFALGVLFKPSPGRFLMSVQGQSEQFILKAPNSRTMRFKKFLDNEECSGLIPACKDLGETLDVHTAWVVDQVMLIAEGGNLSGATQVLFPQIASSNHNWVEYNSMRRFSVPHGEAEVEARDGARELQALAIGDDAKITGTSKITVIWKERPNVKGTYASNLYDWTQKTRSSLLLNYGKP